jgi:hypothetical protein
MTRRIKPGSSGSDKRFPITEETLPNGALPVYRCEHLEEYVATRTSHFANQQPPVLKIRAMIKRETKQAMTSVQF